MAEVVYTSATNAPAQSNAVVDVQAWPPPFRLAIDSTRAITANETVAIFYAEDYGAVGDGVHDDTVAIQAAMDAAYAVYGVCQLLKKRYRITAPLNIRRGQFTLRGVGWSLSGDPMPRFADAGEVYDTYIDDPTTDFRDGITGTVIWADGCNGLQREGSPNTGTLGSARNLTLADFALVSRNWGPTALHIAMDFARPGFHDLSAHALEMYEHVGLFHWDLGFVLNIQYRAAYRDCMARGCNIGILNGDYWTDDPQWSGQPTHFYHVDLSGCGACLGLYNSGSLRIFGAYAQNYGTFVRLKPNPGYPIAFTTLRDVMLDGNGGTAISLETTITAPMVVRIVYDFEADNWLVNDPAPTFFDQSTAGDYTGFMIFKLRDINCPDGAFNLTDPQTEAQGHFVNCNFASVGNWHLGAPQPIQDMLAFNLGGSNGFAYNGQGRTVVNRCYLPQSEYDGLPSPTEIPARNLTGTVTLSDNDVKQGVTFTLPEVDTDYFIQACLQEESGAPSAASHYFAGPATKTVDGFDLQIAGAPGIGNSVTYRWLLLR